MAYSVSPTSDPVCSLCPLGYWIPSVHSRLGLIRMDSCLSSAFLQNPHSRLLACVTVNVVILFFDFSFRTFPSVLALPVFFLSLSRPPRPVLNGGAGYPRIARDPEQVVA